MTPKKIEIPAKTLAEAIARHFTEEVVNNPIFHIKKDEDKKPA